MKILIAGSSGLIGTALSAFLKSKGHEVRRLQRHPRDSSEKEIIWNPSTQEISLEKLEGFDAVINLAGENIANGRWTEEKKEKIYESRVKSTSFLAQSLSQLKNPPEVLINASAIGFYGSRGAEKLSENSPEGQGFLAKVCHDWEEAANSVKEKGMRVVFSRFGMVLSTRGGALAKMLPIFKFGLGGKIGSGNQYISWIVLDELLEVIEFILTHSNIQGPVNVVTPNPVTNREFTKTLGKIIKRPTILPVPSTLLKLLLGEMAEELLLSSTRALPKKLEEEGYAFQYPFLNKALEHILK